jgi:hypothetical protein
MAYSAPERATLFALMAQGREVANNALKEVYKIDLKAASRAKLNRDGLVISRRQGRSYVHELTDKGWAWVKTEFTQEAPPRSGSLVAALYGVLAIVGSGLDRRGLTLADLTVDAAREVPTTKTNGVPAVPDQIRTAYRQLAKRSQDWVYLSELRPLISGVSKAQIDSALKEMHRERAINLTLEEDQKSLTSAQRSAAIRIGVDDMHLIAME